jgi:phosphomannomutase
MGLLDGFSAEFGPFVTKRTQVALTEAAPEKLGKIAKDLESLAKRKVNRIVKTDGLKLYFEEGGWLLVRPSGTEPVARIYAEASSKEGVDQLLEAGRALFAGG